MKGNRSVRALTQGAVIAALYVALTYAAALMGLSSGVIQIRLSGHVTATAGEKGCLSLSPAVFSCFSGESLL